MPLRSAASRDLGRSECSSQPKSSAECRGGRSFREKEKRGESESERAREREREGESREKERASHKDAEQKA